MSIERICELLEHMSKILEEMADAENRKNAPREYIEVAYECYYEQKMAEDGWRIESPGRQGNCIVSRPFPMKDGEA